jgi:hypothetical protein
MAQKVLRGYKRWEGQGCEETACQKWMETTEKFLQSWSVVCQTPEEAENKDNVERSLITSLVPYQTSTY